MLLRMKELHPDRDYTYICMPTGDELPVMNEHWKKLEELLGQPLIRLVHPEYPTLNDLINHMQRLPNFRQRWCTRILKMELSREYYEQNAPCTVYVGLRADEEARKGNWDNRVNQRYPLRELGWGLTEVRQYLKDKGVEIPRRTDCARCFFQRIGEWFDLWHDYPDIYADAEAQEEMTGHTFMAPGKWKGRWPHALKELRAEFEGGRIPQEITRREKNPLYEKCRICSM